jgi:hypothetical protein
MQPKISHRVPWAETHRLANMGLRLFRAADQRLAHPDKRMGMGKIPVERQRMFAFGDALCGALGEDVDHPQRHVRACVIGN